MNVVTELLVDKRKLAIARRGLADLRNITYAAASTSKYRKTPGEIYLAVCKVIDDVNKG